MPSPKLNILIYPMLSVDVINADSNYIIIKQICNELVKTNKYNFILLLDSNRKHYADDLSNKVKIINVPFPKSKKHQVVHFNTNILKQLFGKYVFDIIWNNVVEQGHNFKYFQDTIIDDYRTKVFNYHHYVIHRSLDRVTSYLPATNILFNQVMGSLGADLNYFHTEYCKNMMIEEARDIILPIHVESILNKSIIKLGGYGKKIKSSKKYEKFTFVYNHRLSGYKNWKTTFEIFDKLYEQGFDFQVICTAGDKDNINTINKKPYVIVKAFTKHEDYLKELSKCHANTINSQHETYCISIAESILNDQLVILPNSCTFPELVGKDYPYLFDNIEQQEKILKHIIKENIKSFDHNKNKLLITNHVKNIDQMFQNLGNNRKPVFEAIKNIQNKQKIKHHLLANNELDFHVFKNFLFKMGYATQSFPLTKIKILLNEFGYQHNILKNKFIKI